MLLSHCFCYFDCVSGYLIPDRKMFKCHFYILFDVFFYIGDSFQGICSIDECTSTEFQCMSIKFFKDGILLQTASTNTKLPDCYCCWRLGQSVNSFLLGVAMW